MRIEHPHEALALDRMQITISQRPDVGRRRVLGHLAVLAVWLRVQPKGVAEYVALAQDGHHLLVLDHLERAANNET